MEHCCEKHLVARAAQLIPRNWQGMKWIRPYPFHSNAFLGRCYALTTDTYDMYEWNVLVPDAAADLYPLLGDEHVLWSDPQDALDFVERIGGIVIRTLDGEWTEVGACAPEPPPIRTIPEVQKNCHRCGKPVTDSTSFEDGAPDPWTPGPRCCYECGGRFLRINTPEQYREARAASDAFFAARDRYDAERGNHGR